MKRFNNFISLCGLVLSMCLIACNRSETTSEKNDTDSTLGIRTSDISKEPSYDPSMDPLTVGAEFTKKLGDTLNIKMYELTLKPGDSATLHTHPDHTFYVIQGGQVAVTFQGLGRQVMDLKPGMGGISGPVSDAIKNIGNTSVKLLIHDIYRPRGR